MPPNHHTERTAPPVLILQNMASDSLAYLGTWLRSRNIGFELRNAAAGESFPESIEGFAALAILGGEMSANDPLPALRQAERLFLQALDHGVPTIGHCLGGQLMARALGARVTDSPAPEVGWQTIEVLDSVAAASWLGPAGATEVFHWHYEAFDLPAGAELLARSRACPNQAFAIGPHLAMQFHVEVDAAKIDLWSRDEDPRYDRAFGAHSSVQSPAQMRAAVAAKLAAHQALADRVYARWASAAGLP